MNFCFTMIPLWAARQCLFQHLEHFFPFILLSPWCSHCHIFLSPLSHLFSYSFFSLSKMCFHRGTPRFSQFSPEMGVLEAQLPLLREPVQLSWQHLSRDSRCSGHRCSRWRGPALCSRNSSGFCLTAQESLNCSPPNISKSTGRDYLWSQRGSWQEWWCRIHQKFCLSRKHLLRKEIAYLSACCFNTSVAMFLQFTEVYMKT